MANVQKEATKKDSLQRFKFDKAFQLLEKGKKVAPLSFVTDDGLVRAFLQKGDAFGPVVTQVSQGNISTYNNHAADFFGDFVEVSDDMIIKK